MACETCHNKEERGRRNTMDKKITVHEEASKLIKKGYPLLTTDMVIGHKNFEEGQLLNVTNQKGELLGTAYSGKQNKGIGWMIAKQVSTPVDAAFFKERFTAAKSRRDNWLDGKSTTAYRLFNGEGDGFGGITVDVYNDYLLIQWYSKGAYTFKKEVYQALEQVMEPKGIYEKIRFDHGGTYLEKDDFVQGQRGEFPMVVQENEMNFAVDLNDGAMTGIFLDQRYTRQRLRDVYAEGKTVLNTFSYTGAFSVAACLGGARTTTSVDLAKRSEAKTIEQMSVNGIDFEAQEIRVMDVFNYFNYAIRNELKWDVVVLDPPSFARSKKMNFSTAKDYPMLMERAAQVTQSKGVIIASTNNASFGMKKFKTMIEQGLKQAGRKYKVLEDHGLKEDFTHPRQFPQFNYLKVVIVQLDVK